MLRELLPPNRLIRKCHSGGGAAECLREIFETQFVFDERMVSDLYQIPVANLAEQVAPPMIVCPVVGDGENDSGCDRVKADCRRYGAPDRAHGILISLVEVGFEPIGKDATMARGCCIGVRERDLARESAAVLLAANAR